MAERIVDRVKSVVRKIPVLRSVVRRLGLISFPGSARYWEHRYKSGDTSGAGSYGRLAEFKMEVLNDFVTGQSVDSIIEFGCGDGAQLSLANYPSYTGLDISEAAVDICKRKFKDDDTKRFMTYDPANFNTGDKILQAQLALSLDVIFHLVEDEVYETYISNLFRAAQRYVIIYSSNHDENTVSPHVRHRKFTDTVESMFPGWELTATIRNKYPYDESDPDNTSFSDFYVFEKPGG